MSIMYKLHKKKKTIVTIAILSGIAILLLMLLKPSQILTFEEGFTKLKEIDKKYNTSFHTEMLNKSMVPLADIQPMIKEIEAFENKLNKDSSLPEMKALFLFTDIRKLMLTSQWYFQKGKEIGEIGLVNDEDGFSCKEAQFIIDAAFYFNESYTYGLQAEEQLDDLLYMHKYHPKLWSLVGIDENRTRFFRSDLQYVKHIPINNLKSLDVYCNIRNIKHETTFTKKFDYKREIVPKEVYQ